MNFCQEACGKYNIPYSSCYILVFYKDVPTCLFIRRNQKLTAQSRHSQVVIIPETIIEVMRCEITQINMIYSYWYQHSKGKPYRTMGVHSLSLISTSMHVWCPPLCTKEKRGATELAPTICLSPPKVCRRRNWENHWADSLQIKLIGHVESVLAYICATSWSFAIGDTWGCPWAY